jgi:lysophospholipase L1-like esterase
LDLRALFAERCPDPECRELLFPDEHPNAAGYRIVASEVSRKLAELLAE